VKGFFGFKTKDPPKAKAKSPKTVKPHATQNRRESKPLKEKTDTQNPREFGGHAEAETIQHPSVDTSQDSSNGLEDHIATGLENELPDSEDPIAMAKFRKKFEEKWIRKRDIKNRYKNTKGKIVPVKVGKTTLMKAFQCPACKGEGKAGTMCATCCANFKFTKGAFYLGTVHKKDLYAPQKVTLEKRPFGIRIGDYTNVIGFDTDSLANFFKEKNVTHGSRLLKIGEQSLNEKNWEEHAKNFPLPATLTFNFDYIEGVVEFPPEHFCPKCKGKGCLVCDKGRVEYTKCTRCKGRGKKNKGKCRECHYSGLSHDQMKQLMNRKKPIICTNYPCKNRTGTCRCNGKGVFYLVACEVFTGKKCKGKGCKNCAGGKGVCVVPKACKSCRGTGGEHTVKKSCSKCNGSGLTLFPGAGEAGYLPLTIACTSCNGKEGCTRCISGKLYRRSCSHCPSDPAAKCNKCNNSRLVYRGLTEQAQAALTTSDAAICGKCKGTGRKRRMRSLYKKGKCGACSGTGLKATPAATGEPSEASQQPAEVDAVTE